MLAAKNHRIFVWGCPCSKTSFHRFITQTQSWEAEKLAYEEKIRALEARIVDYEASFFNKMMNDQYVMEGSLSTDKLIANIHF